jgi:hypothetical protein
VLSVVAHVLALLGTRLPMQAVLVLGAGVFVVWLPFVLATLILQWSRTAVAFPAWWRWTLRWALAYVGLHFVLANATMTTQADMPVDPRGLPAFAGRLFSAGWILFYGAATAGLAVYRQTVVEAQEGPTRPTSRWS